MVLKFHQQDEESPEAKQFPSPCGDMVLKLEELIQEAELLINVSVPLRGYGFEICAMMAVCRLLVIVSVPLRGYGFEMIKAVERSFSIERCFRPLAGIWF